MSCCCMSLIPAAYTIPHPSNSSVLLAALAGNWDWWTYHQLWALQTNYTEGQLIHKPFYRPLISLTFTKPCPIQVGSEHFFEWRTTDQEEIIFKFHLTINPPYGFLTPHSFVQSNSHSVSTQFLWFQISTFDKVLIPTTTHFPGNWDSPPSFSFYFSPHTRDKTNRIDSRKWLIVQDNHKKTTGVHHRTLASYKMP